MSLLDDIAKILNIASGPASAIGTGQQQERNRSNEFADARGRTLANIYGTQVGAQTGIYGNQANNQTAQYNAHQDALTQALLGASREQTANAAVDLDRRKFALTAPGTRAGQAASGSILQNLQPSRLQGGSAQLMARTPTITGGAINALGPGAREAGRLLEQGALAGLRSGDTFDPLTKTDFQGGVLAPPGILAAPSPLASPTLPAYQGPGGVESALGAIGAGGGILNAIKKLFSGRGGGGGPSGPGDTFGLDPYTYGGGVDTSPPVPPPGPTGETGGRFYTDPMNLDPFNPYTYGGRVDTNPPTGPDTSGSAGDLDGYWDGTQWVSGF
jgi:hypothetical protein